MGKETIEEMTEEITENEIFKEYIVHKEELELKTWGLKERGKRHMILSFESLAEK